MIQRLLFATLVLLVIGIPDARAQEVLPVPSKELGAYEQVELECGKTMGAAKERLVDVLNAAIAGEKDDARKKRLKADLAAFLESDTLPASVPKGVGEYASERRGALKKQCHALAKELDRCRGLGDAEALERRQDELAALSERRENAEWDDLRCDRDFERNVTMSGVTWDGPAVLTPVDRDMRLRVRFRQFASYQLRLTVERVSGDGPLEIAFPLKGYQEDDLGVLVLDGGQGSTSGLEAIDKRPFDKNNFATSGVRLAKGDLVDVIVTYQTHRIQVEVDGQTIIDCDEVKKLSLPSRLKGIPSLGAAVMMSPRGTQFRIHGLGSMQSAEVPADPDSDRSTRGSPGLPDDMLPKGRVWQGRDERNNACTMTVVARNQGAGTATLEFSSGKWRIKMLVKNVARNGSGFAVGDVKRLDARVSIWAEKGRGSVSAERVHVIASWRNAHGGEKEFREYSFTGRR